MNENCLVALALLIAESNPRQKDLIVRLLLNLLEKIIYRNMEKTIPANWVRTAIGNISEKPQYGWTTKANHENGSVKSVSRKTNLHIHI